MLFINESPWHSLQHKSETLQWRVLWRGVLFTFHFLLVILIRGRRYSPQTLSCVQQHVFFRGPSVPRCKCVHLYYLKNLRHIYTYKYFFFFSALLSAEGREQSRFQFEVEVVDHESASQFGNKFDIRLGVRTQNGSVVREKNWNVALFAGPTSNFTSPLKLFFWSYHVFWLFPSTVFAPTTLPLATNWRILMDLLKLIKLGPITLTEPFTVR